MTDHTRPQTPARLAPRQSPLGTLAAATLFSLLPGVGASAQTLLSEGFNDITTLPGAGWVQTNNSAPLGATGWFQGNDVVFPAQSGAATSYIGANFNNASGAGTISDWLITPVLSLSNGETISFYTRTTDAPTFADRLELRLSTAGTSSSVGSTATSVGDFTSLLLTVNPNLTTTGYPATFTQFTATITGLSGPATGRFAFRYFVTDAGPDGNNSDYIGIDTVQVAAVPEPSSVAIMAFGGCLVGWVTARRRKRAAAGIRERPAG